MPRGMLALPVLALAPVLVLAVSPPWMAARAASRKVASSVPPVCPTASHERLLQRAGRDICGPTLSPSGRPTAAGFLPTECPQAAQTYRIDAFGTADRCIGPIPPEN
ncbi:hypothetical protein [Novosphingobium sp.]|uniref:hypothetical protein n=1 Tax=Novosphingobium sp. TaxID=1874826 RepID=UPI0035B33D27